MITDPYQPPQAPLDIPGPALVIRERDVFVTWLLVIVIGGILGMIFGGIVGAIIGGVAASSGGSLQAVRPYIQVIAFVVGLVMSYLVFRYFVRRMIKKTFARQ